MSAQLACYASDVPVAGTLRVELEAEAGTVEVALVRDEDGELHAISDICSHGAVSLSDGEVEGCTVECWLHGSRFDLRTGKPLSPPAVRPVPVYPVTVDGERVLVDVDAPL
ncbi:non-heme iron oxygenase ferredoxin subunit [Cellulomonas soli]|uniref:Non-heme iron oxygenase ferredoxin subunit n=1 Tax=Cellulomonas soli TaxID=931535 RepID=A0A512PH39_9CELL|nr:non-heme iron oxygenase ferredoxin subunit [Cellulomonas soli]NYI60888.1 3-phenylpropionate/trans-cinnamate dioxygenase ferredoxin subunit [Cellulomonas soli]GEP70528.1 non-heme iron oxygenase ferredoxin subunit [Cellulomonas soli]